MRYSRRHDLSARVEMIPLIDVIFLLLTFFIYSLVMMVQAQILPVRLSQLTTADPAQPGQIQAITIDRAGSLYLNRKPIASADLDAALSDMAKQDPPPKLFLAMQIADPPAVPASSAAAAAFTNPSLDTPSQPVTVDRGPLLIDLIERVRRAGLSDFAIVGQSASP
jgi:biopolymer transport protein ExbD